MHDQVPGENEPPGVVVGRDALSAEPEHEIINPNALPARFVEDTSADEVADKPAARPGGKTSVTNKPKPKGRR